VEYVNLIVWFVLSLTISYYTSCLPTSSVRQTK